MARLPAALLIVLLAFQTWACKSKPPGPPPIGEAYVGPPTLVLRKDLGTKGAPVATLKHGEHLDVLQTRRRFAKVRTNSNAEGWVDSRQLISTEQMQGLREMEKAAANIPVQGRATTTDVVNIHTEPVRASPSFAQLPENSPVDVLLHKVNARNAAPQAPPAIVPEQKRAIARKPKREKRARGSSIPPPPLPPPPPPPPNWLQLSQSAPPDPGMEEKKEPAKPVPLDDWTFIRTKDGKAGWILTGMLNMSIPDEVAQYAEGHRITSYFPLFDVKDEDGQMRHYWLWTTLSETKVNYEFDSFRVFIWSLKRHRYETAYIERKVIGYYPVEAHKGSGEHGEGATFSLILEDDDGQFVKKTYVFNGYRVSLAKKEPYTGGPPESGIPTLAAKQNAPAAAPAKPGLLDRLKNLFKRGGA